MKCNKTIKKSIAVLLILAFFTPIIVNAEDHLTAPVNPGPMPAQSGGGILGWVTSGVSCFANPASCGGLASKIFGGLGSTITGIGEKALASLAASAKKNILDKLYQKMLDYISGEGGQVLDWGQMGKDTADEAVGLLLSEIAQTPELCNPFDYFGENKDETNAFLKIVLGEKPPPEEEWSCSALAMKEAGKQFFENFEGGWDAWLEISTQPMANPYGQYLYALEKKSTLVDKLTDEKEKIAIAGGGFLGQEKWYKWHLLGQKGIIKNIQCLHVTEDGIDVECVPLGKDQTYCGECLDEDGFEVGLKPELIKQAQTMPATCLAGGPDAPCQLIVDEKEIITPGSVFAGAASKAIFKDLDIAQSADASILEYYTSKLLDDIFGSLFKRGLKAVSSAWGAKDETDGFSITSRREQIASTMEKASFEVLKSSYEDTLQQLREILSAKTELKLLLRGDTVPNDLRVLASEFFYCTMNECVKQEYSFCKELHGDEPDFFDPAQVASCQTKCETEIINSDNPEEEPMTRKQACEILKNIGCKGDNPEPECPSSPDDCDKLDSCKLVCETNSEFAIESSELAVCRHDGWEYCAQPRLDPNPRYDNPEVLEAYEFWQKISFYAPAVENELEKRIQSIDYGGFAKECEYNQSCVAENLKQLLDFDTYIQAYKTIINHILYRQPKQLSKDLKDIYNANSNVEHWQNQLRIHKNLRERYSKGFDSYKYITAKQRQLREFYTKEYTCNDEVCNLHELADLIYRRKQVRALKMKTWDENKAKWTPEKLADLSAKIEDLNTEIEKLQTAYDAATQQFTELISEIGAVINPAKTKEELETAQKFLGANKEWLDAEKTRRQNYIDSMTCTASQKTEKPQEP